MSKRVCETVVAAWLTTFADLSEHGEWIVKAGYVNFGVGRPRIPGTSVGGESAGRWRINHKGVKYTRARINWAYINGPIVTETIDHRNERKWDDRPCNLRGLSKGENTRSWLTGPNGRAQQEERKTNGHYERMRAASHTPLANARRMVSQAANAGK